MIGIDWTRGDVCVGGGRGELPYLAYMGTNRWTGCGFLTLLSCCMFFGIFVLNRVSNLSFFVLIRVSVYQFLS